VGGKKAGGREESWWTERKLVGGKKAGEREETWWAGSVGRVCCCEMSLQTQYFRERKLIPKTEYVAQIGRAISQFQFKQRTVPQHCTNGSPAARASTRPLHITLVSLLLIIWRYLVKEVYHFGISASHHLALFCKRSLVK
jgi:hypothetical protein